METLQKDVCKLNTDKVVSENCFKLINGLIQREESRLTINEIINQNLLSTTYKYYQGNNQDKCKQFSGFM